MTLLRRCGAMLRVVGALAIALLEWCIRPSHEARERWERNNRARARRDAQRAIRRGA